MSYEEKNKVIRFSNNAAQAWKFISWLFMYFTKLTVNVLNISIEISWERWFPGYFTRMVSDLKSSVALMSLTHTYHAHTYVCTCTHTWMHTCTHTHTYAYEHTHTHTYTEGTKRATRGYICIHVWGLRRSCCTYCHQTHLYFVAVSEHWITSITHSMQSADVLSWADFCGDPMLP